MSPPAAPADLRLRHYRPAIKLVKSLRKHTNLQRLSFCLIIWDGLPNRGTVRVDGSTQPKPMQQALVEEARAIGTELAKTTQRPELHVLITTARALVPRRLFSLLSANDVDTYARRLTIPWKRSEGQVL
jgi:hypothetical protein